MEPLQHTTSLIRHPNATAFSALPDAPVVPDREHAHASAASRLLLARALHRLGDAVAPTTLPTTTRRSAWAGSR